MNWMSAVGDIIGGGFSLIDDLNYSEQEKQADALTARGISAQEQLAKAQTTGALAGLQAANTNAESMKFLGILGAGVAGLGLVVYAMRA